MFRGAFEGADRSTWFRRCVGWLRCGQKSPERLWEHDKESHTMADLNVVKTNILILYWYVLVIEQMLRSEYVLWLDRRGRRWKHWGRWSFRSSTQRTWLQRSWHSWITTWAKYRHSVVVKTSCGIARNTQSNNWENCQTTGLAALNAPSLWVATSIDYPLASFDFLHKEMLGSSGLL